MCGAPMGLDPDEQVDVADWIIANSPRFPSMQAAQKEVERLEKRVSDLRNSNNQYVRDYQSDLSFMGCTGFACGFVFAGILAALIAWVKP